METAKMKNKQGQVLLITVMLLATALTVVLSSSFRSTTEIQTTKLQEDSEKALAAAQAGIEKALKVGLTDGGGTQLNIPDLGNGTSSNVVEAAQSAEFTTAVNKDDQYTFYLGTVNDPNEPINFDNIDNASFSGALTVCFNGNIGLEFTTISKSGSTAIATKTAVNGSGNLPILNAPAATTPTNNCPSGTTFDHQYDGLTINSGAGGDIILVVRVIGDTTSLGFKSGSTLPPQGKIYISTGSTTTGVTKKVQLFQSYPQIPSDFFVTSF